VGQLGAWQPVQQQLWQTEAAPGKGSTTAASLAVANAALPALHELLLPWTARGVGVHPASNH